MKQTYKPEEVINYLKNKNYKANQQRLFTINRNNSIIKSFSIIKLINSLNIENLDSNAYNCSFDFFLDISKKFSSRISDKKVLNLINDKISNENIKRFFILSLDQNHINMKNIKKYFNIKKKIYKNESLNYFMANKSKLYFGILNQGMVESFINFNIFSEEKYLIFNNDIIIDNFINNKVKYDLFNIKKLNNDIGYLPNNFKKVNIYLKCVDIYRNGKNKSISKNDVYFFKGLNHNMKYELEEFLKNKMSLLEVKNNDSHFTYDKTKFIKKFNFQFIKSNLINNINDNIYLIDRNKPKISLNETIKLFPLFINDFSLENINKNFYDYIKTNNKELNIILPKGIERFHSLSKSKLFKNYLNTEEPSNILNGAFLANSVYYSLMCHHNFRFNLNDLKTIALPKLNMNIFKHNKYKQKRTYPYLTKKKALKEKLLIVINLESVGKYLNDVTKYLCVDNISEGLDILFDFNVCGKILYATEIIDEFDVNGYNNLMELINKNYLLYSIFYIFIIDDQKLQKNNKYSVNKIKNKINNTINENFGPIINSKIFQLKILVKVINYSHLISYEINNIYNGLIANNSNDSSSIFNKRIYNQILENIKNECFLKQKDILKKNSGNSEVSEWNFYEKYLFNAVSDEKLKEMIKNIVNKKYTQRNIK